MAGNLAEKLPVIRNVAKALSGAFDPKNLQEPPTDQENVEALNEGADRLKEAAGDGKGVGAVASIRLAALLTKAAGESSFAATQMRLAKLQTQTRDIFNRLLAAR